MTPAQIDLARRLADEGAKRGCCRIPDGQIRDEAGIRWRWSDEMDWVGGGSGRQVPDLTDAATAGVLLDKLECTGCSGAIHPPLFAGDPWQVVYWLEPKRGRPTGKSPVTAHANGSCLGEAAARAWLEVQEAP